MGIRLLLWGVELILISVSQGEKRRRLGLLIVGRRCRMILLQDNSKMVSFYNSSKRKNL
jgi:hypothetical protein